MLILGLLIFTFLIFFVLFSFIIFPLTHKKNIIKNKISQSSDDQSHINILIRQVYRWYLGAAQDTNPLVKMLHANYAMGYLMALRSLARDIEIKHKTGLDMHHLEDAISNQQDLALKMISSKCPKLIPKDPIYQDYLKKFINISKI